MRTRQSTLRTVKAHNWDHPHCLQRWEWRPKYIEFRAGSEWARDGGRRDLWSSVCSLQSLYLCHLRWLCLFLGSLPETVRYKPSSVEKTPQSHSPVSAWGLDVLL